MTTKQMIERMLRTTRACRELVEQLEADAEETPLSAVVIDDIGRLRSVLLDLGRDLEACK